MDDLSLGIHHAEEQPNHTSLSASYHTWTDAFTLRPCHAEGQLLHQQATDIKQAAIHVSQLRRVGKGLGVFELDRYLQQEHAEREDGLKRLISPLRAD